VPSANRTWICQGPGVGDEINHLAQSHKFADGNVHIVGAKRVGVRIGAEELIVVHT